MNAMLRVLPILILALLSSAKAFSVRSLPARPLHSSMLAPTRLSPTVTFRQCSNISVCRQMTQHDDSDMDDSFLTQVILTIGLAAQPVVWLSLYTVATTGAGLPAGPFGLVGATEGISYLIVVGIVVSSFLTKSTNVAVERTSQVTLALALLTLASLVAQQGCVPNAKPLLDYSAYLPICETTPGIFGER